MLTLSHPSHQAKSPVYRGFKWVTPSEMLKPPKSGDLLADQRLETVIQRAQAFGTEGESYSNLPKAFEVIEDK